VRDTFDRIAGRRIFVGLAQPHYRKQPSWKSRG
jgi:hypothetical protein